MTYRELDTQSGEVAGRLRALGVGPDRPVGLMVTRSPEMVVALLGILKAGGAYVPLDPEYSDQRVAFMLEDTGAPVVITREALSGRLERCLEGGHAPGVKSRPLVLIIDAAAPGVAGEVAAGSAAASAPNVPPAPAHGPETVTSPAPVPGPENLCYITYTSGSTGRPKGVAVPHRAVVRLVKEANYARIDAGEVFVQFAPVAFDASPLELWAPLLCGGRLVLMPPGPAFLEALGEVLRERGVTTIFLTTALFNLMVEKTARRSPRAEATDVRRGDGLPGPRPAGRRETARLPGHPRLRPHGEHHLHLFL